MLTALPRPTIFAHRGSSAYAPENTLSAFELAIQHQADAVELDVKLSQDNIPVVIHDPTVDRTTNGSGFVRRMTLEELRKLDAGEYFNASFRGERIPTLEEVLTTIGRRIFINIELTNYASPNDNLPEIVAELIQKHNLSESILISSFNPLALWRISRLLPQVPRGLLALRGTAGSWARSWIRHLVPCEAVHPAFQDVTPNFLRRIHRSGQRVHAYTVNLPEDMRRLLKMGVDGIFTDDPVLARKILSEVI